MKTRENRPRETTGQNPQGQRSGTETFDRLFRKHWDHLNTRLREDYTNLTEDDLRYEPGKESELYGRIQRKTGMSRPQFEDWANREIQNQP